MYLMSAMQTEKLERILRDGLEHARLGPGRAEDYHALATALLAGLQERLTNVDADNRGNDPSPLGAVWLSQERRYLEGARTAAETAVRIDPDHAGYTNTRGIVLRKMGRIDEASRCFQRAAEMAPRQADFQANYGLALIQRQRYPQALLVAQAAVKAQATDPKASYCLGLAYEKLNDAPTAIAVYHKTLTLSATYTAPRFRLAVLLANANEHERAVAVMQEVIAINPRHFEAYSFLARFCLKKNQPESALEYLDKALAIRPDDVASHVLYGRVGRELGRSEASFPYQRLLGASAFCPEAMAAKALAAWERGDEAEFHRLYDQNRFVFVGQYDAGGNASRLVQFNHELCDYIKKHPTLILDVNTSNADGRYHTYDLGGDCSPVILHFIAIIKQFIQRFADTLPTVAGHPFLGQRPQRYRLWFDGSFIRNSSFIDAHVHTGHHWMSGVYYVSVPQFDMTVNTPAAGAVVFGNPNFPLLRPMPERVVNPQTSMVVLFPSYFYHHVNQFIGNEDRVTINYDVVPVE